MDSYIATTLVGGAEGRLLNDIETLTNREGHLIVDERKAIRRIILRRPDGPGGDQAIRGLNIWYKLKDADAELLEVRHGYQGFPPSSVDLRDAEVLVGIFGRAGYNTSYKRKMILSIGFTIFDNETVTVRVEGPFGNVDDSSQGEPFHVADVMALGAYVEETETADLTGLIFYKPILSA